VRSSVFNFNGGTLRAKSDQTEFLEGLTAAYVQSGGARIDTANHRVRIGQSLWEDPGRPGGGLLKEGAGTLILSGDGTYRGGTLIREGTLELPTG